MTCSNVTIRPVGASRFEIILPTGGAHRTEIEKKAWQSLLEKVKEKWKDELAKVDFDLPPGQEQELIARVNQEVNWSRLKAKLVEKYPAMRDKADVVDGVPIGQTPKLIDALKGPTGASAEELKKFIDDNSQTVPLNDIEKFITDNYHARPAEKRASAARKSRRSRT